MRWGIVALVVAAIAVVGWRYAHTSSAPVVRYQSAAADQAPSPPRSRRAARVSAIVTVQVGSQVSGRIQAWYVDFSSPVKKGQLIAHDRAVALPGGRRAGAGELRRGARPAYDKAVANRTLAERNYARAAGPLRAEPRGARRTSTPPRPRPRPRAPTSRPPHAAVQQARAALDQAQLNLSYTRIVSPIDGIVISRNIDVGQTVAASFQAPTLFTIAQDLTKMQVDTNVAEGDVGKIHERHGGDVHRRRLPDAASSTARAPGARQRDRRSRTS